MRRLSTTCVVHLDGRPERRRMSTSTRISASDCWARGRRDVMSQRFPPPEHWPARLLAEIAAHYRSAKHGIEDHSPLKIQSCGPIILSPKSAVTADLLPAHCVRLYSPAPRLRGGQAAGYTCTHHRLKIMQTDLAGCAPVSLEDYAPPREQYARTLHEGYLRSRIRLRTAGRRRNKRNCEDTGWAPPVVALGIDVAVMPRTTACVRVPPPPSLTDCLSTARFATAEHTRLPSFDLLPPLVLEVAAIDLEAGVQMTPKIVKGTGEDMLRDGIDSCDNVGLEFFECVRVVAVDLSL
ncbi:hypothetical protein PR048_016012 [Dryococelus australis]|uniref:Uncharacterized protein n=1 Tax=Dryococelus australis TaxID=614101 RepID=A0ABQ9HIY3_9NEOP|nr:hypothetical protein PR048_016012 [Dryococelus australis]